MALRKADGTVLTKSVIQGTTLTVTPNPATSYTAAEEVWEDVSLPGSSNPNKRHRKLKYRKGQVITAAEYATLYGTAPTVPGALSPATGGVAGGTTVTITGTGLSDTTGVTFGGTAATALTIVSDTQITCKTPAKSAGAVTVVIQHPAGDVTKATAFTYA